PLRPRAAAARRPLADGRPLPPLGRLRDGRGRLPARLRPDAELRAPEPLRVPDLLGYRRGTDVAAAATTPRARFRGQFGHRTASDPLRPVTFRAWNASSSPAGPVSSAPTSRTSCSPP